MSRSGAAVSAATEEAKRTGYGVRHRTISASLTRPRALLKAEYAWLADTIHRDALTRGVGLHLQSLSVRKLVVTERCFKGVPAAQLEVVP